jgi:dephospho-CoA kinase
VTQPTKRPIGPYERRPVQIRAWDPRFTEVAARVSELIRGRRPELRVEHIGSTAVPGLPGKGIVDLATEADPAEIPAITEAVFELGFGPQPGPDPWPPTRPMHVGSFRYDGEEFLVHFHVHPQGGGDFAQDLRFRDALIGDPALAAAYAQVKERITDEAGGVSDRMAYQDAKGEWILETYDRLGIPRPSVPPRLVEEPT